jgi:HlyD family secretion protein
MKNLIKIVLVLLILAAVGAGGYWAYTNYVAKAPLAFRTSPVQRGEVLQTINATGTVEPEEVVDVGAQVAGEIIEFGKDVNGKTVDFDSVVNESTTLAKIDDSLYQADVDAANAMLQQAQANVVKSKADLDVMKAKLFQADRDWQRAQKLGPSDALAQSSYDSYQSAYEIAKASVTEDEAVIVQCQAAVAGAQTSLERAKRNLGYCTIVSPVQGVVIARRVNVGQTVVSSLNAPSLFLIAKDLKRIQVWVSVNEADISNIHEGQPVTFKCDGAPGIEFTGTVDKIRLDATMSQNVVTYTVIVAADNSDLKLKPYLTANVFFEVARHKDVLKVPNAALRWAPRPEMVAAEFRNQSDSGRRRSNVATVASGDAESGAGAAPSASAARAARSDQAAGAGRAGRQKGDGSRGANRGTLWVQDGQFVKPIKVRVSLTDGLVTEVESPELHEDMEIVIDTQRQAGGGAATTNPFVQQAPGRGPGGRGM